jgi:hypothetical protein
MKPSRSASLIAVMSVVMTSAYLFK